MCAVGTVDDDGDLEEGLETVNDVVNGDDKVPLYC